MAIYIGPSGFALVGQLQNIIAALTAAASAGVGTGVTRYTAEYDGQPQKQYLIWQTSTCIGLVGSGLVGLGLVVFHEELAGLLMKDRAFGSIFIWTAACLVLFVINTLFLSILNGLKRINLFVAINISNSLTALFITALLAYLYGIYGALVALAINQSIVFVLTIWLCRNEKWLRIDNFLAKPSNKCLSKLSKYAAMSLVTSIVGPITLIFIRNHIITNIGSIEAGYWEAITRISSIFLMMITTPLSVYYLPKLVELRERDKIIGELIDGVKIISLIVVSGALLIYVLRIWLIELLFTNNFLNMQKLFFYELIGDVFRAIAWLFSFYLISKGLARKFVIIEVTINATYFLFAIFLTNNFGLEGVVFAYAINNLMYLAILVPIVFSDINRTSEKVIR